MTDFIKGVSMKLLESSITALILAVGVYYLWGETQHERKERISELKLSHASEVARATALQAVVEQNSMMLKKTEERMEEHGDKLDDINRTVKEAVARIGRDLTLEGNQSEIPGTN